jgi:hypothetical protein
VNAGTWEVQCQEVAKERCNATEFASNVQHFDGCDWETKWERHAWMSAEECADKKAAGLLLPDGTECAYHQDCKTGCCGSPAAGSVCVPCDEPAVGEDTVEACTDGTDNDGGMYYDCGDVDCCSVVDCSIHPNTYCAKLENTVAACMDEKDNDGDGFIDCDDGHCCAVVDCSDQPDSYCATH